MSLKKFLSKIWNGVKKLFEGLEAGLKKALPVITNVVNRIKEYSDVGGLDVLTALIPGNVDDKIAERIKTILPDILIELEADAAILALPTTEEKIKAIIAKIQGSGESKKKVFYTGLANLLTEKFYDDGKLSWGDALVIQKYIYDNKINEQAE